MVETNGRFGSLTEDLIGYLPDLIELSGVAVDYAGSAGGDVAQLLGKKAIVVDGFLGASTDQDFFERKGFS